MVIDSPWQVLAIAGVGSLSVLAVRSWISSTISARAKAIFDHALEQHKHDLQQITESSRFDYARRIQDFGLYAVKKHAVNARLYRFLLELEGRLSELLPRA